jgi:hypothetical protein
LHYTQVVLASLHVGYNTNVTYHPPRLGLGEKDYLGHCATLGCRSFADGLVPLDR